MKRIRRARNHLAKDLWRTWIQSLTPGWSLHISLTLSTVRTGRGEWSLIAICPTIWTLAVLGKSVLITIKLSTYVVASSMASVYSATTSKATAYFHVYVNMDTCLAFSYCASPEKMGTTTSAFVGKGVAASAVYSCHHGVVTPKLPTH